MTDFATCEEAQVLVLVKDADNFHKLAIDGQACLLSSSECPFKVQSELLNCAARPRDSSNSVSALIK